MRSVSSKHVLPLLLAVVGGGGCRRASPPEAPPPARHLVIVSIDTLRADHLGCYGHPFVRTPHIDAVAAEGIRFTRHYVTAPTTLASHASLMTGLYPAAHGAPRNGFVIDESVTMLAEHLREQGFVTAAFIGAFPLQSKFAFNQGFDVFDERFDDRPEIDDGDPLRRRAGSVSDAVVAWLQREAAGRIVGRRLFLFVHYFDVHWPYTPIPPYDRMYRDDALPIGGTVKEIRLVRESLRGRVNDPTPEAHVLDRLYSGSVSYVDAELGQVIDALKAAGVWDEAVVIITSDHGETMWEHPSVFNHGPDVYNTTIYAPLIVRLPGTAHAGQVNSTLTSNVDVAPTALDWLGARPLVGVHGVSVAAAVAGEAGPDRAVVFAEATKPRGPRTEPPGAWPNAHKARAAVGPRYKLIQTRYLKRQELYDLEADPLEQNDLLREPTPPIEQIADELTEALAAQDRSVRPRDPRIESSRETTEALRDLGYITDPALPDGDDEPPRERRDEK